MLEAEYGDSEHFYAQRRADPALSKLGEEQAACLGEFLSQILADEKERLSLYVSPMKRALQTIQPLSRQVKIKPIVHPRIFEVGGMYQKGNDTMGVTMSDISEFGYDLSMCPKNLGDVERRLCGKESAQEAMDRILKVGDWLKERAATAAEGDIMLLVVHADFMEILVQYLLCGVATPPPGRTAYFEQHNTQITHLVLGAEPLAGSSSQSTTRLLCWNRVDHLETRLRSGVMWKNFLKGVRDGAAAPTWPTRTCNQEGRAAIVTVSVVLGFALGFLVAKQVHKH